MDCSEKPLTIELSVIVNINWRPNDFGYLLIAKNIYKTMLEMKLFEAEPIKIFSLGKNN